MQDDAYLISAEGWKAETYRIIEKNKAGKEKDKGWTCDLVPKELVVGRYFSKQRAALEELESKLEGVSARLAELEEEHGGEEGFLGALDKIGKLEVKARLKEIQRDKESADERAVLREWLQAAEDETELKGQVKRLEQELDAKALAKYPELTESDIKALVVDDKWMENLSQAIVAALERISQELTRRVKTLAERYESTLPELTQAVQDYESKVAAHLAKMGFAL
jgi:type I restriction enzyme M protein